MQIHDIEETGAEYDERKAVIDAENKRNYFVNKLRREIAQGQLSFR